jgi:hypothetical protein
MGTDEPPRRPAFVTGQLLTAEVLQAEQDYHRGMRRLHNRLHGYGVVDGLDVALGDHGHVTVGPGLALDAHGRELVVTDLRSVDVSAVTPADGPLDLVLVWDEVPDRVVPGPDGEEVCTQVAEVPRLALAPPSHTEPDGLLLARLSRADDGTVSVDATCRRALGRDDDSATGPGRRRRRRPFERLWPRRRPG